MQARSRQAAFWLATTLLGGTSASHAAVLGPEQSMHIGQRLYSSNGSHFVMLSEDGDFAVYRHRDTARVWSARTAGSGAVVAKMLRGGQFVLTDHRGATVWTTGTRGRHRVFGVMDRGTAVVLKARKWKPRDKKREPFVEEMLKQRAYLEWQSKTVPDVVPPTDAQGRKRKR